MKTIKKRNKRKAMKCFACRFPTSEGRLLKRTARKEKMTISSLLRMAWIEFMESHNLIEV